MDYSDRVPGATASADSSHPASAAFPTNDRSDRARGINLRKIIVGLLLLLGVQMWLILGHGLAPRDITLMYLAGAWLLLLIPPVRRALFAALEMLRTPSRSVRLLIALGIAVAAGICLFATAVNQGRSFDPYIQDEFAYLIQTRMLATGRLWLEPHPLGEAFENFYLLHEPNYAAIYFPGTALLYVATIWLHLPSWAGPLMVASVTIALVYRVVSELIDGVAGVLAAMIVASTSVFRWMSLRFMATVPVVFFGMLLLWAFLRWRKDRKPAWAVLIGAFAGWAAICRPLDALSYALPIGIVIVCELRKHRVSLRRSALTLALIVAGAAPFLSLQIVFNKGVTGRWLYTPYQLYHDRYAPGAGFGFAELDPTIRAQTNLEQKRQFYERNIKPTIQEHQPEHLLETWLNVRLPLVLDVTFVQRIMLLLVPVALVGLVTAPRWAMWGMLPTFLLLYTGFVFFLAHYSVAIMPAVALTIVLGAHITSHTWSRLRPYLTVAITLSLLILCASMWREFNRVVFDDLMGSQPFNSIKPRLAALPDDRAIVLFRRGQLGLIELEPAYNAEVVWPDEARIIRAHDLGPEQNQKLFEYYARRQPDRMVYHFERDTSELTRLGNVEDLARGEVLSTVPASTGPAAPAP